MRSVIRLNGVILGLVSGLMFGLGIFVATNWLVLKGGSDVGAHLQLLSQYFFGYSVSFVGSFIGMIYGFVTWLCSGLVYSLYLQLCALAAEDRSDVLADAPTGQVL